MPIRKSEDEPILVDRRAAGELLGGICGATLAQLEKSGVLKGVRIGSRRGKVKYLRAEILALARQRGVR